MPMTERYIWHVRYRDGSTLEEYPDPETHRSALEIDRDEVEQLELIPNPWLGTPGHGVIVVCDPERGLRPVVRRQVSINLTTGETTRYHVVGTEAADGRQNLAYIPDHPGPLVLTDQRLETS